MNEIFTKSKVHDAESDDENLIPKFQLEDL
jgi:hypothetical protein